MRTISFIIIIFLISCGHQENFKNINENELFKVEFVKDYLPATENILQTNEMSNPRNNIVFVGNCSDTLLIAPKDLNSYKLLFQFPDYADTLSSNAEVDIFVLSNQELSIDIRPYSAPPPPVVKDGDVFEIDSIATAKLLKKMD